MFCSHIQEVIQNEIYSLEGKVRKFKYYSKNASSNGDKKQAESFENLANRIQAKIDSLYDKHLKNAKRPQKVSADGISNIFDSFLRNCIK